MNKIFTNMELVNIAAYMNTVITDDQVKALPTKFRWNLKKNMDKIMPIVNNYEEFRANLIAELQQEYFNEEKSEEYFENDGEKTNAKPMRKVKQEYMSDYTKSVNDLNDKLREILAEKNTIDISTVDFDAFVNNLPDDSPVDFDALNILCFMDETTNVAED